MLQIFIPAGSRLMPSDAPRRRLNAGSTGIALEILLGKAALSLI